MTSRNILSSYFIIAGAYTLAAAMIWGVNTLFLLDAGLDIFEVFIANAAFTAGSVVFEIPTGVLADARGRRASLLASIAILMATTLAYLAAAQMHAGLGVFCVVSAAMGLGFTFYSGAVDAWLVDALETTGYRRQLDQVFARGAMVTGAAMLLGTVCGGLLGQLDLRLPYAVRSSMLALVFAVAYANIHDLGFTPRALRLRDLGGAMREIARDSVLHGWRTRPVRWLMVCSFLQWGFITWGFYAWQPYFLDLLGKQAVWAAGMFAALIALSMMAGNFIVDWLSRFCGRRSTLLIWAAGIQTVAAVGVGLADSLWLASILFLVTTGTLGILGPVKQAVIHQVIPSRHRASVISLDSMVGNAGGVVGQSGLGYLARVRGIGDGYVFGGLATVIALPVLALFRVTGGKEDRIIGRTAAVHGPCAGQGIPEISQVDASTAYSVQTSVLQGGLPVQGGAGDSDRRGA